jgi:hypothetical protein
MHEEAMTGSEASGGRRATRASRKDMLPGTKQRDVMSAGPGEFAGKVIRQQDLAALLAAR